MIKELVHQTKAKATPRKLVYVNSKKEAPDRSLTKGFSDQFSLKSTGTFNTRGETYFISKVQKGISKGKEPSRLRRSKRLENPSRTKERARRKKSKPRERAPSVLRISAFMYGHGHPELTKKLNEKILKTVDEMFERVRAFIEGKMAAGLAEMVRPFLRDKGNTRPIWFKGQERARNRNRPREMQRNMEVYTPYPRRDTFTPLTKTPREILAMEGISFLEPSPLIGNPKKQNLNKFWRIKGHQVQRIHVDSGSSSEFMENQNEKSWSGSLNLLLHDQVSNGSRSCHDGNKQRSPVGVRQALKEKVSCWLKEGIVRRVYYPEWVTNAKLIKLVNGIWQVQMDYSSLNKICAKDMFPFPVEEEELASLMGYRYKCFLRLPKDDNQIRMAGDDKEKTRFHTEKGPSSRCGGNVEKAMEDEHLNRPEQIHVQSGRRKVSRYGWTNKAEKSFQRIKRKLNKLQTLIVLKEGEEKEVKRPVMKRFYRQGEQGLIVPDVNEAETSELGAKLQAELMPTPRAWRLYLSMETIKEGGRKHNTIKGTREKVHGRDNGCNDPIS
nr:reverse transcriptase domain-containing protein [Tanacetum cinerariifolium]